MLQMRIGGGGRGGDDYGKSAVFLHKNVCCDHSLDASRRDGSNERSMLFSIHPLKSLDHLVKIIKTISFS